MHPATKLLDDARAKVKFPLKEMTKVIYGNQRIYDLVIKTQEKLDQYPEMVNDANYFNKGRKEQFLLSPKKLEIVRSFVNLDLIDETIGVFSYFNSNLIGGVFLAMVVPALRILGNDEQIKRWEEDFKSLRAIAAYAQTEIGHGSDVQNLETTATFDKLTDEFIIHTPSISATKFWPGELGLYSNWALVYAQLIIENKNYGVYPFMVQIRDEQTHQPLPGVTVGDIGPKLGYSIKDNGYLSFNQVRIPRFNLFQRYLNVDRNGTVTKIGNEKVSYAAMMIVRKLLIYIYGRFSSQALTIAIRYSIVRNQGKNDKGQDNSIIEYQSQQDKILPLLAKQYAVIFGGFFAKNLVEENFDRVKRKDFSMFQLTHAILSYSFLFNNQFSSGSKANYTYFVQECQEWCRLSCGGHGFAHYSGMPGQTFELTPNITLEGENKVMYLQLARFLLKIYQWSLSAPEKIPPHFAFFADMKKTLTRVETLQSSELISLEIIQRFLEQNVAFALQDVVAKIQSFTSQGMGFKQVWDFKVNESLVLTAAAFMEYFNFAIFHKKIEEVNQPEVKSILTTLCQLYGVHIILNQCSYLMDGDLINQEQFKTYRFAKEVLLLQVKDQAIGLVDAFEYSDNHLKTLIGCYDGQHQERLFEWVSKKNSMNQNRVAKGILDLKSVKPRL